jgi:hypothetical protein
MLTVASSALVRGYVAYLLFRYRDELQKTGSVVAATRNSMLTSGKAILFVEVHTVAQRVRSSMQ